MIYEFELIPAAIIFCVGAIVGMLVILLFNKLRTGSASAGTIKQEFEEYQAEVEAHFEGTSKKFKDMAAQYQDLYQHLSVGATTLCRSENLIAGLSDQRDPLATAPTIELARKKVAGEGAGSKPTESKAVDSESSPKTKPENTKINSSAEPSNAKSVTGEAVKVNVTQAEAAQAKVDRAIAAEAKMKAGKPTSGK